MQHSGTELVIINPEGGNEYYFSMSLDVHQAILYFSTKVSNVDSLVLYIVIETLRQSYNFCQCLIIKVPSLKDEIGFKRFPLPGKKHIFQRSSLHVFNYMKHKYSLAPKFLKTDL